MAKKTRTVKDIFAHLVGWHENAFWNYIKHGIRKTTWFVLTSEYDFFNLKIRNEFDVFQPDNLLQELKVGSRTRTNDYRN